MGYLALPLRFAMPKFTATTLSAAFAVVSVLTGLNPFETFRRIVGRSVVLMELVSIQLKMLLYSRNRTTWTEYFSSNLDVLRFLKLMWLFRTDVLDTRGRIFSSGAPKHIMASKLAKAAAKGENIEMASTKDEVILKDVC